MPPPKIGRPSLPVHSCGTGIYRKKIDTQKVYMKRANAGTCTACGGAWGWATFVVGGGGVEEGKRTAPSVPEWSPTSVLTGPDQA